MFLSSLFVFLSIATAQPVADVPVQVTQHVSTTRYQFKYQENEYIIDLSAKLKILAYYINNELQNPALSPSTQKELLRYDEKSKLDLLETFDVMQSRTPRPSEMTTEQSVADIPVQVTEHISSTRYQFKYQENEHIIDLNSERKILAYYIDNKLQNPRLIALIQKELLQYEEKFKTDLSENFDHTSRRTRRRRETWQAAYRRRWEEERRRGGKWVAGWRGGSRWVKTQLPSRDGWRVVGSLRGEKGWKKIRPVTRVERKNNRGINIKINWKGLSERLLNTSDALVGTGAPYGEVASAVLTALGVSAWVFSKIFDD